MFVSHSRANNLSMAQGTPQGCFSLAHFYLQQGLAVIPLMPRSKRPALDSWIEFQHRQPTIDEIATWWHDGSDNNIAIVCGRVSNLVVLDIDDPAKFEVALKALGETLPDTPVVKTRKGWHVYFRYPVNRIVRRHDRLRDWGCELRGDGCYVVAPPSVVDGHRYHWAKRNGKLMALGKVPLADPPSWLLDAFSVPFADADQNQTLSPQTVLNGSTLSLEQKQAIKAVLLQHWHEGQRHEIALGLAGLLAKAGVAKEEALKLLRELADEAGDNEWRDRERALQDTFERLWRGETVVGFKRLEEVLGDQIAKVIANIVQVQSSKTNEHLNEFKVFTAADLLTLSAEPIPAIVDGLVFKGMLTVFIGEAGVGKTTLFYHLATALAKGETFLNRLVAKPCKVLFIDAETPIPLAQAKLGDLLDPEDEAARRFYWLRVFGLSADDHQTCEKLIETVRQIQPDVVFVDPLNAVMLVQDFNDEAEARKQLLTWKRIADELGCAVILSAHPPKDRSRKGAARWRGSFARIEIVDIAFSIEGNFQSDTLTLELVKDRTGCAVGKLTLRKVGGFEVVEGADEDAASRWILNFITKAHNEGKAEVARAEILAAAKEAGWAEKTIANRLTALVQTARLERPRRGFYRLPLQSPEVPAPNPKDLEDIQSPNVPNVPQGLSGLQGHRDEIEGRKVPQVPQAISGTLGTSGTFGTSGTLGTLGTSGTSGAELVDDADQLLPEVIDPEAFEADFVDTETLLAELEALPDLPDATPFSAAEDKPDQPDTTSFPVAGASPQASKPDNLACLCGGRLRPIGRTYKCLRCDNPLLAACRKCGTALQVTSDGQAKCLQCGLDYSFDRSRKRWLSDEDTF